MKRYVIQFILRQIGFASISIVYYHSALMLVFTNSPLEITYFKAYSFGAASNYYSAWGYFDLFLKLNAYSAFFIQRIVSMILLLNSSFLIMHFISSRLINTTSYPIYTQVSDFLLSLLLSFNPLLSFIYPYFGFSYFAFMNIAIFCSLSALSYLSLKNLEKTIIYLIVGGFFLTISAKKLDRLRVLQEWYKQISISFWNKWKLERL